MLTLEDIQHNVFLFYAYAFYEVMNVKLLFSSTSAATRLTGEEKSKNDFHLMVVGRWSLDPRNLNYNFSPQDKFFDKSEFHFS